MVIRTKAGCGATGPRPAPNSPGGALAGLCVREENEQPGTVLWRTSVLQLSVGRAGPGGGVGRNCRPAPERTVAAALSWDGKLWAWPACSALTHWLKLDRGESKRKCSPRPQPSLAGSA